VMAGDLLDRFDLAAIPAPPWQLGADEL
jgi:hypothetical protein